MRKLTWTWLLCATLLLTGRLAHAQTGTGGTGGSATNGLGVTKADFNEFRFRYKNDKGKWVDMNKTAYETYFNRGNCECEKPVQIFVSLLPASRSKLAVGRTATFELRAGDSSCVCNPNATTCAAIPLCKTLAPALGVDGLARDGLTFEVSVRDLFLAGRAASDTSAACDRDSMQNVYLYADSDDGDTYSDLTDVTSTNLWVDGLGPTAPSGLAVVGGNEALEVSWNKPTSVTDLQGYQVLCARGNGTSGVMPVFAQGTFTPRFNRGECTAKTSALTSAVAHTTDAGADASTDAATPGNGVIGFPPQPLADLDPLYACSDLLTNQSSERIRGLQNGIPYAVSVVSIDKRGNASRVTEAALAAPTPTRDFYSGYRAEGGEAEGGCAMAGSGGAGAVGLGAGGALALLVARRRRRRGPGVGR